MNRFFQDEANRLTFVIPIDGGSSAAYSYDASNQRIYASVSTTVNGAYTTNNYIYFYGADGKKLGVWQLTTSNNYDTLSVVSTNVWFGGRLWAYEDRLQSVGKYFPYGEDRYNPNPANPSNDQEKFATYTRDAVSGLDYAVNRYYSAGMGRFMSADPYVSTAGPLKPQGWNRYPYAQGDPVNRYDPKGLFACDPEDPTCELPCDPDDPSWCDPCPNSEARFGPHASIAGFGGGSCGGPGPQPDPTPNPPRVWDLSVGFVPVPAAPAGFDHLFIWIHVAGISAAQSNTSNSIVFDGGPSSGNCTLGPVLTNHVCFGSVVSWSSTTGHYGEVDNPNMAVIFQEQLTAFSGGPLLSGEQAINLKGTAYNPVFGRNSNSVAYTLLLDIGITVPRSP
ncbi:MAG: RHS repeat-associated core domain-containing protein [Bryobacteraceae bacterium]